MNFRNLLAVGLLLIAFCLPASAQNVVASCGAGAIYTAGQNGRQLTVDVNGNLCSAASITPSGTQNTNLTQILGATPSPTNPLWVSPATGATFPVSPAAAATGGATYARIAAGQATTIVKASAGTLYAICLNSAATATNTTNVYDNASGVGTVIATPAATTATVPTCLNYGPFGVAFALGLTIITATANGADMTVSYK